jgi:hypothetical protein
VSPFLVTRTLPEDATEAALRADVLHGLTRMPKALPPKWFYEVVAALGVSRAGRVASGVASGLRSCHVAILHRVAFRSASRPGW